MAEKIKIDLKELREVLKKAKARTVTDWEKDFVKEQIERFKKFGETLHMSQKQFDMLTRISEREIFDDDEL